MGNVLPSCRQKRLEDRSNGSAGNRSWRFQQNRNFNKRKIRLWNTPLGIRRSQSSKSSCNRISRPTSNINSNRSSSSRSRRNRNSNQRRRCTNRCNACRWSWWSVRKHNRFSSSPHTYSNRNRRNSTGRKISN